MIMKHGRGYGKLNQLVTVLILRIDGCMQFCSMLMIVVDIVSMCLITMSCVRSCCMRSIICLCQVILIGKSVTTLCASINFGLE